MYAGVLGQFFVVVHMAKGIYLASTLDWKHLSYTGLIVEKNNRISKCADFPRSFF
jgi:hypothetical protein